MRRCSLPFLTLLLLFGAGCSPGPKRPLQLEFRALPPPVGPESGRPNLFAAEDGRVYLSWTEPADDSLHALRFSVLEDGGWSAPRTVARGRDWFVNWADFPSLVAAGPDTLVAHYLVRSGGGTYAYDVHITASHDGGRRWSPALVPHRDGTPTEHGFVSLLPGPGHTAAVWLDGRNTAGAGHGAEHAGGHDPGAAMTLRYAELDRAGRLRHEALLDERVCDCCGTAAVRTAGGLVVFYRDRSAEEVRDIAVVRLQDGRWSAPETLHADGWKIPGCPVNGPAAAAAGRRVAVAWFTGAAGAPRVQLLVSEDEGRTFGPPVRIDEGRPLGRVDVELLPDGRALVSWMETTEGGAAIRLRAVHPDGTVEPPLTVAETSPSRAGGFPRMARRGDRLYVAWTEVGTPSRVRTAVATLPD